MNALRLILLKARDILGLPSMQEVLPGVYAGNLEDERRTDALKAHNIRFILNVADEIDDPDLFMDSITQAKEGLVDWDSPQNEDRVQDAISRLNLSYKLGRGNILVHCEGGRNRTLYVLARWWARLTGRDWREVVDEIIAKRPEMALHDWMKKQGPK